MTLPTATLSEALAERVDGRPVRAAVFTTFSFDPGFFEEHVLPSVFDYPFSHVRKVRMVQLEDKLRECGPVAVYYDRTALVDESGPAMLDVRRIDVRRSTGCFHPKLVFVLVANPWEGEDGRDIYDTESRRSLIVGTLSANLTRAGWWENVEAFHFEEVFDRDDPDAEACPFRGDLVYLLDRLRRTAASDEEHAALDQIETFVRQRTPRDEFSNRKAKGRYYTRLWAGKESLADFVADLRLEEGWNLEIVSPYFDKGDADVLEGLIDAAGQPACRIHLPRDAAGRALVDEAFFRSAAEAGATWASLPDSILKRSGTRWQGSVSERRVHAKLYRFWRRDRGSLVIVGSPNLTSAGLSSARSGNLEAAFLFHDEGLTGRWWLEPVDSPATFAEHVPPEDEAADPAPIDITIRYDWGSKRLEYRLATESTDPLELAEPAGRSIFVIESPQGGSWQPLPASAADAVRDLLASTSLLLVRRREQSWRILVREENMVHRPSLLKALTPEEILLYWSLLSPEQRAAFIEEKGGDGTIEGLAVAGFKGRYDATETMFDRFAGLYHAFERLREHVEEAFEQGQLTEIRARLFGEKYDSLPVLLDRVRARPDRDPVLAYLTHLCAAQLRTRVARAHPDFWGQHAEAARGLEERLARIEELKSDVARELTDPAPFLEWYEQQFLEEASAE